MNVMNVTWSEIQCKRLKELDVDDGVLEEVFPDTARRDSAYGKLEKQMGKQARFRLKALREEHRIPKLPQLERVLTDRLTAAGFVQVTTPTIMSRAHLAKMSVDHTHPLHSQVFWLEKNKCLRPMLAPHLYYLLKDLLRLWEKPVRIFEVGSCFRKESQGAKHANEFTMLNLVEMGLPPAERETRLQEYAELIMTATGLDDYRLEHETSAVYGETIDITTTLYGEELELGSAAMGPHRLDEAWRIAEPWVGIGFGLERLLMAKEKSRNLAKMGRSLAYLDGVRLNV